jgi:hypothetical protein
MSDDGYVSVPLQFSFPFYGKTFTESYMYDNGVVSFINPAVPGSLSPYQWSASLLSQAPGNYFIAPLWADIAPVTSTTYTTQGSSQFQRYNWNNIAEYYSVGGNGLRLSNFSLEIKPDGEINTSYSSVNLITSNVSVGTVGNISAGEYDQKYYAPYGTNVTEQTIPQWNYIPPVDPCNNDPLSNPSCPGFGAAYALQQAQNSIQQEEVNVLPEIVSPSTQTVQQSVPDSTKTDLTVTDVGGAEITTDGQVIVSDNIPQVSKESVKEANQQIERETKERPTPLLTSRILSIVRAAIDDTQARTIVSESISQSYGSSYDQEQMMGLGSGVSVIRTTIVESLSGDVERDSQSITARVDSSSQLSQLNNKTDYSFNENDQTSFSSLKKSSETGLELGASIDINTLLVSQANLTSYLNVVIKDGVMYPNKEIYRNQQNIDNKQSQRLLNTMQDRMHQEMTNGQYR